MRKMVLAVLTAAASLVAVPAAMAGNPHFVTGTPPIECVQGTASVSCSGGTEIAGVGNNNAEAVLVLNASGVVDCNNPSESNQNNPIESHETTFTVEKSSGQIEPKNGRLTIPALSADAPTSLTPQQESALCPNPQWDAVLRDVVVTGFTYSIFFLDRAGNRIEPAFFTLP